MHATLLKKQREIYIFFSKNLSCLKYIFSPSCQEQMISHRSACSLWFGFLESWIVRLNFSEARLDGQCGATANNTPLVSHFTDAVIRQRSKNKQKSDIFGQLWCSDALLKWFSTGHDPKLQQNHLHIDCFSKNLHTSKTRQTLNWGGKINMTPDYIKYGFICNEDI